MLADTAALRNRSSVDVRVSSDAGGRNHVQVRDVRDPHKVFVELSSNEALDEAKEVFHQTVASCYGQ